MDQEKDFQDKCAKATDIELWHMIKQQKLTIGSKAKILLDIAMREKKKRESDFKFK